MSTRSPRISHRQPLPRRLAGSRLGISALGLLLVTVMGAGGVLIAVWYWSGGAEPEVAASLTHVVARGPFVIDVTAKGDVESADNVEIRCEVKSKNAPGTAILRIVPEGTFVEADEFLVELDATSLEEERTQQQIAVNTSEAVMIQSQYSYETAVISRQEYVEGTFKQEQQTIQGEVFVAQENQRRAEEYLGYSRKLAEKGYIARSQLDADEFAVKNAENELGTAKTKLRVLEKFTRLKMLKQLDSDVAILKTKWESDQNSHQLELAKLAEIDDQIAKCTIRAPSRGQVVYANKNDYRGNADFIVEEGAVVREQQAIVRLPDPARMQVRVEVNESLVGLVYKDLPASIRIVSLKDVVLPGSVLKANPYAEPTSRWEGNTKKYRTFVQIDSVDERVLSGMTAEVVIHCHEMAEVVQVPAPAIHAHGADYFAVVETGSGRELRKLEVGPTNDAFVVIEAGLAEGDVVALNPQRYLDELELPPISPLTRQQLAGRGRLRDAGDRGSTATPRETARPPASVSDASAPDGDVTKVGVTRVGGPADDAAPRGELASTGRGAPQLGREPPGAGVAEGGPAGGDRAGQMFSRLDRNNDGALSSDEWPREDGFSQADTNGDGRVVKSEMAAAMRRRASAPGRRPGAGVGG